MGKLFGSGMGIPDPYPTHGYPYPSILMSPNSTPVNTLKKKKKTKQNKKKKQNKKQKKTT